MFAASESNPYEVSAGLFRQPKISEKIGKKWIVALCLLLILLMAAAEALHLHPANAVSEAKHCPACQLIPSLVQLLAVALIWFALRTTRLVTRRQQVERALPDEALFLLCRPPVLV